jgi:glutamyl-tRNA(Gln) amidotransferase subunit E
MRLGSELAGMARFWGRVGGIFHTDEMPAYGVTEEEVSQLGKLLKQGNMDAIVFVADTTENATDALKAVIERAKTALKCVPEETRSANPDGTTKYMRPRPGAARMYPETDVPPIQVTEAHIEELMGRLPELPEQLMKRLMKDYGINQKLAKQILDSEYLALFEDLATEKQVSATVVAVALTETLKALKRDGVTVEAVTDEQFREMFGLIGAGKTVKENIPEILTWLPDNEDSTVKEAIKSLGLGMMSRKELEDLVADVIEKNSEFIELRGKGALGPLMGIIMKKARGKAKTQLVNQILKIKLDATVS